MPDMMTEDHIKTGRQLKRIAPQPLSFPQVFLFRFLLSFFVAFKLPTFRQVTQKKGWSARQLSIKYLSPQYSQLKEINCDNLLSGLAIRYRVGRPLIEKKASCKEKAARTSTQAWRRVVAGALD